MISFQIYQEIVPVWSLIEIKFLTTKDQWQRVFLATSSFAENETSSLERPEGENVGVVVPDRDGVLVFVEGDFPGLGVDFAVYEQESRAAVADAGYWDWLIFVDCVAVYHGSDLAGEFEEGKGVVWEGR